MATDQRPSDSRELALGSCLRQRDHCQECLRKAEGTNHESLVRKALLSAELSVGLLQMKEVDKTKALHQALQKHIQSILDLTYYQETCLVDSDFPESTFVEDIQLILDSFSNGITICGSTPMQIQSLLGEEVIECLHWRVGALLYMATHTIMNDEKRKETANKGWLKECCRVGILHMKQIFHVRDQLTLEEGEEECFTNDSRLPDLLKQGIRSDTHMLALAYGGELCYWYKTNTEGLSPTTAYPGLYNVLKSLCNVDHTTIDNADWEREVVSVGIEFLSKYVEAAEGSERMQSSWQCERPKQLIAELKGIITSV